ncbi:dihydroxyacetone kinase subunit DhaK [uncultured Parolsenella sp.]|mgnify:FL=1|uniref:dihydroxyacetone kinase subunit DhaK n=1 Tax=uncultured Parolsenella sp. TaxID=2083008 RepID=UPI0027DE881B|nr:dihydroxyacetone kinase subunit DhaK [uncultured Parolsenella sp.]
MKKFINRPEDVERQVVDGYVKSYPALIHKVSDDVVVRTHRKRGKVALVSGGGMGHEPAHLGYVGTGMLDAAVGGAIYTSPAVDRISAGIEAVAPDATGVLLVVKNYTGDVINFKLAEEAAREEGVACDHVVVNDDVAVGTPTQREQRRGVAGTIFVHKCAGAAAEAGKPLAEVKRVAEKVIDNVRTMGVGIAPCTVPAAGKPGFTLADDEMEMGVGIHGEPGIRREKMEPVDAMVDEILDHVLADIDYAGHEVAVLVNGAGGTPDYELALVANHVHDVLSARHIGVWHTYMGNYLTSLEMRGFSVSLLRLDDELKNLLSAPADTPAWQQGEASLAEDAAPGEDASPKQVAASEASNVPAAEATGATKAVIDVISTVAGAMEAHKDELTELDQPIGDSDHGINMARGFSAARALLPSLAGEAPAAVLKKVGSTLVSKVGGSSGPLYGTLFRKVGVALKADDSLASDENAVRCLAAGLSKAFVGIEDLGGAKPGDKTMLDAMQPAMEALEHARGEDAPLVEALAQAADAAEAGAEATVPLQARKGRASYLGERSVGHKDPGAASFALLMRTVANAVAAQAK